MNVHSHNRVTFFVFVMFLIAWAFGLGWAAVCAGAWYLVRTTVIGMIGYAEGGRI